MGHVLLISPETFDYHLRIQDALREVGLQVTWSSDRLNNSTSYIVLIRYMPMLANFLFSNIFIKKLEQLDLKEITHVLVIKGEGISSQVMAKLHKILPGASFGYYLWDGISNVRNAKSIISKFHSVSTFDPVDAVKHRWHYRPLFGRDIVKNNFSVAKLFDWCFIGTIHSDRYKVINSLKKNNHTFKYFFYPYIQTRLVLIIRRILDLLLSFQPKNIYFTTPLTSKEIDKIISQSKAVLDIEHPNQNGYTMRSIEVLISGNKLITTNRSILESDLYHPSRVMILDRLNPILNSEFLKEKFKPIENSTYRYYTCVFWVKELLSLQDRAYLKLKSSEENI